jgi:hypothetical protein
MTEILGDPYAGYLQDPTGLVDPYAALLTPAELEQEAAVKGGHGLVKVAVGLGASYLVYRAYMSRRLGDEVKGIGHTMTYKALGAAAAGIWSAFVPRWIAMTAPYLVAGYIEGVEDIKAGDVPREILIGIAQDYAEELGMHLNAVSLDAVLSGYQAQVNRKVPPIMAAQRVADAYGVPQRSMNTLVSIWSGEDPKNVTDRVLPSAKADRAHALIVAANQLRARQVGDNEAWAARTQAKQVVWMYGVNNGVIPAHARRRWITADDEKVCEICGPMDGVAQLVSEKFHTPSGLFWTPPTHVNCRCDVALDLTDQVQEELDELLASETVTKAYATDKFDRDKKGRFSKVESRGRYKEREAEVDALLAQVNEALATPVKVEDPALFGEKATGGPNIFGAQGFSAAGPKLWGPKLWSEPLFEEEKKGAKIGAKLGADLGGMQMRAPQIDISPSLFHNTPIQDGPIETDEGQWHPIKHPLVAILPNWGDENVNYKEGVKVLLDADTEFYEVRRHDSTPDRYERSLEKALGDYWTQWMRGMKKEYANLSLEDKSYRDPETGRNFNVDFATYQMVLYEVVENIPRGASDVRKLAGYGEYADDAIEVSLHDIAQQLGIHEEAADAMPHLLVVKHVMPGVSQLLNHDKGDVWSNPGRWNLIGNAKSESMFAHYQYEVHYAEPEGLND